MRKWTIVLIVLLVPVMILSCTPLGIQTDESGMPVLVPGGPVDNALGMLGYREAVEAGLGVLSIFGLLRGGQYKRAGLSLVRGVKVLYDGYKDDKKISKDEMIAGMKAVQEQDKTRGTVNGLIAKVSGKKAA